MNHTLIQTETLMKNLYIIIVLSVLLTGCKHRSTASSENNSIKSESERFPAALTDFISFKSNPVFSGTGTDTWDQKIRERGYILLEDGIYYLWYTGYKGEESAEKHLGLATSTDGLSWTRYKDNPIYDAGWVEDMSVIKHDSKYCMFAEGRGDTAHLLTSTDRINWIEQGQLDIRKSNGEPLSKGAFGTPAIWYEEGVWYLFYEREDLGIWLAVSTDLKVWTNKQDEPVIKMGPESYDQFAVAMDQIIKYNGRYYGYYHATEFKDWHEWTSCVAVSEDLIHWEKYIRNPIMRENKSSPIMVFDGEKYNLYTMHPEVCIHFPKK
jgi:beta-1,2-mannobiose phosphorylase / 1,2-beta-oligomannan phosphorylase